MNRAYQLHLEQIEAHETSHPSPLAVEALQALHPDLSCITCYPPVNLYHPFRRFWRSYKDNYFAHHYTQKTNDAYRTLVTAQDYNSVRAAARDIVFSCRYNNDLLDPKEVIAGLLLEYTQYTLASTLPRDFDSTLLDLYIEDLLPSFALSPTRLRTQNLLSGLRDQPFETELDFETSAPRSIFNLGPEQLADPQIGSSSLPPYNEDTTYIPFRQRFELPSSPISEIPLYRTRQTTPPPQSNRFLRWVQSLSPTARTNNPPPPPVVEFYPTVNLDIDITPRHTPPIPDTPPPNYFNLADPLDYYTQNQETTIIRPDLPQQQEELNLQSPAPEVNPSYPLIHHSTWEMLLYKLLLKQ